jgi:hypothetical protein
MDTRTTWDELKSRYEARHGLELFTDKEVARLTFIKHLSDIGYIDEWSYNGVVAQMIVAEEDTAVAVA